MICPDDFRKVPDWLLGGYWGNDDFYDLDGNLIDTKEFGDNGFHGRTHPAICYMAIQRLTVPGDLVYVPFSGSGTEIDVCQRYGRRVIGIDLNPRRPDIRKGDATRFRLEEKARLIIAHPPYEDVVLFSNGTNDLSKRGTRYEQLVSSCADMFFENLVSGGYLVLIIGDTYHDGREWPLDYIWYSHLVKFDLIGRIVRNFGETKSGMFGKNKNLWKYRLLKNKRFKLANDFVLIFEVSE